MVDDGVAGESACSSSRLLRRITVNAFARLKRATLQCRVPKCALHSDDLGVFVVSQKKERVFSKNLLILSFIRFRTIPLKNDPLRPGAATHGVGGM